MNKFLIVLAGGVGRRFNENLPKQYFVDRDGISILKKSVLPFKDEQFEKIIIVCDLQYRELIADELSFLDNKLIFTSGGLTRMDSIIQGLNIIKDEKNGYVFIQESVRPYVSNKIIDALINAPKEWDAVVPVVSPAELYGKLDIQNNTSNELYAKQHMIVFQMPKRYKIDVLLTSINNSNLEFNLAMDESEYIIESGHPINLIEGSHENIKITFPFHKKSINN